MREIIKIGLVVFRDGQMLLARKAGSCSFILPGGKPERGEDDADTLGREIDEELGCRIDSTEGLDSLGTFSDVSADDPGTLVHVRLYAGALVGSPAPASEIEELRWVDPTDPAGVLVAPSLANSIMPWLVAASASGRLARWQLPHQVDAAAPGERP